MTVSWILLIPVAVGSSMLRGFLGIDSSWIGYHVAFNTLGIAVYCTSDAHGAYFEGNTHKVWGLVLVILVGVQHIVGHMRPHLPTAKPIQTTWTSDNGSVYELDEVVTKKSKSASRIAFEIGHRLFGCWTTRTWLVSVLNRNHALWD
jgi:hypothetical protein